MVEVASLFGHARQPRCLVRCWDIRTYWFIQCVIICMKYVDMIRIHIMMTRMGSAFLVLHSVAYVKLIKLIENHVINDPECSIWWINSWYLWGSGHWETGAPGKGSSDKLCCSNVGWLDWMLWYVVMLGLPSLILLLGFTGFTAWRADRCKKAL